MGDKKIAFNLSNCKLIKNDCDLVCERFSGFEIVRDFLSLRVLGIKKISIFNKITSDFELADISEDGLIFNRLGIEISNLIFNDFLYIPLLSVKNKSYNPSRHHGLISGDLVYIRRGQRFFDVGVVTNFNFFKSNPIAMLNNGKLVNLGNLLDEKYARIELGLSKSNSINVFKNLFNQDYLVIGAKNKTDILKINYYRATYEKNDKKLKIKAVLFNSFGEKSIASLEDDEISSNFFNFKFDKLAGLKITNSLSKNRYESGTPAYELIKYGVEKYCSELCVAGFNNYISLNEFDSGGFAFEQKVELNNNQVGFIKMIVMKSGDSDWVLNNVSFDLCREFQNQGISKNFYLKQERLARALKIKYIEMNCSSYVGGYAWAKMGFKFKNSTTSIFFRSLFLSVIENTTMGDWRLFDENIEEDLFKNKKEEILNELNRFKSLGNGEYAKNCFYYDSVDPIDFANFRFEYVNKDGRAIEVKFKRTKYRKNRISEELYSIGKSIMLGTSWDAVKEIA